MIAPAFDRGWVAGCPAIAFDRGRGQACWQACWLAPSTAGGHPAVAFDTGCPASASGLACCLAALLAAWLASPGAGVFVWLAGCPCCL